MGDLKPRFPNVDIFESVRFSFAAELQLQRFDEADVPNSYRRQGVDLFAFAAFLNAVEYRAISVQYLDGGSFQCCKEKSF